MVNRIWPTVVAGKADSVSSVSASACHIGGPNSVNSGQILLVYGMSVVARNCSSNYDEYQTQSTKVSALPHENRLIKTIQPIPTT